MNLSFLKSIFKKHEPKIGLVLGAGGARGFAHIGVLKALEEKSIKLHSIAGCSAGALIGGLYSAGANIKDLTSIINELTKSKLAKLFLPSIKVGGLVDGERIKKFIEPYCKNVQIEDLSIKFCANAVDLITREEIVFSRGSLLDGIRASISIPGIFTPVQYGKMRLVDGGVLNPLPIDLAYKMGAEYIIAVDVIHENKVLNKNHLSGIIENPKMLNVILISLSMIQKKLINEQFKNQQINVLINPKMEIDMLDFHRGKEAIEAGYYATIKMLETV